MRAGSGPAHALAHERADLRQPLELPHHVCDALGVALGDGPRGVLEELRLDVARREPSLRRPAARRLPALERASVLERDAHLPRKVLRIVARAIVRAERL